LNPHRHNTTLPKRAPNASPLKINFIPRVQTMHINELALQKFPIAEMINAALVISQPSRSV
jgi:hypothetical protein